MLALSRKHPSKRAFITGAGSGLGLTFAEHLARDGWTIGITDVNADSLAQSAETIIKAGGTVQTFNFDVSDYGAFSSAIESFCTSHGGIDIGINNAGVGCGGFFHDVGIETFRRVIEINLMGVVNGCHLMVPVMKKQHSGHILNIASAAAFASAPQMSAYNTSKAGVVGLSETLRGELLDDNILVSVLMPTYIKTNIGRDALGSEYSNHLAQKIVEESALTTEQVVRETFISMSKEQLYIVLPAKARFLWRYKRLMPAQFWRTVEKEAKRYTAETE